MFLKISEQDWNNIKKALNDLPVSLTAHQSMANLINVIETQCRVDDEVNVSPSNITNT